MFIVAGVLSALGAIWPKYALVFVLAPILTVTLVTVIYSYVIYKEVTRSA